MKSLIARGDAIVEQLILLSEERQAFEFGSLGWDQIGLEMMTLEAELDEIKAKLSK